MFALMYKILPRVKIGWRDVWIGSVATALLFTIGKILVGLYIGQSRVGDGFRRRGLTRHVLVWVYYSAQIFLLGAEFTWVYAHQLGSRRDEKKPATAKSRSTRRPSLRHQPIRRPPLQHRPIRRLQRVVWVRRPPVPEADRRVWELAAISNGSRTGCSCLRTRTRTAPPPCATGDG